MSGMLLIFLATFLIGLTFTIILLFTLKTDMETLKTAEKSYRPFYLFFFAIAGWVMTVPALIAPNLLTVSYPAYNVVVQGQTVAFSAFNVTSSANRPFPINTFLSYMTFWSAVMMVLFIILALYLIEWFRARAKQGVEGIQGG